MPWAGQAAQANEDYLANLVAPPVAPQRSPTARIAERLAMLEPGLAALARQASQLQVPAERVLALLEQCLTRQAKESNHEGT